MTKPNEIIKMLCKETHNPNNRIIMHHKMTDIGSPDAPKAVICIIIEGMVKWKICSQRAKLLDRMPLWVGACTQSSLAVPIVALFTSDFILTKSNR